MGLLLAFLSLFCNNPCLVYCQSLTQLVDSILLDFLLIVVVVLADLPVVLAALVDPVLADLVVVVEVLADLFLRLLPLVLDSACLARLPV
jgi:hypothetical protein